MQRCYCDRCGKEIDMRYNVERKRREEKKPYYLISSFKPHEREYKNRNGESKKRTHMRSYYPQYCEACSDALTKVLDMWEPLKYLEENNLLDDEQDYYDRPQCEFIEHEEEEDE